MENFRTYQQDVQDLQKLGVTSEEFDSVISNMYDKTVTEMVTIAKSIRAREDNPTDVVLTEEQVKTNELVKRAFERVLGMRYAERREAYDTYYGNLERKAMEEKEIIKGQQKQGPAKQENVSPEPERKLISQYKGYAYMQNAERPKVIYGNSKTKMLQQLQKWNKTRTKGFTYDICNIGQYDPKTGKYIDYNKYDVNSGKNITKIYLEIPHGLPQDEFNKIVKYMNDNGAKFSPFKKQWYIFEDMKDKFAKYLPGEKTEERSSEQKPVEVENKQSVQVEAEQKNQEPEQQLKSVVETASVIDMIDHIDNEYVIDLKNGETLRITENEVIQAAGVNNRSELNAVNTVEAIEQKVQEHFQLMEEEKYSISVSKDIYDNRCSVYMENGERVDLYGDQFGVHFPSMEAEDVSEIVKNYMKMEQQPEGIKVGDIVTLSVPEYSHAENGFREISGMKEISGELKQLDAEHYVIADDTGKVTEIKKSEVYDERQAYIMEKAISKELPSEQIDLIGQPQLSAAQMEQVYNGLQDGLSINQVAMYANPLYEAWQMDIYRFGMDNGIPFDNLQNVIQNNIQKPTAWEDSRNMVDKMIKAQRNLIILDLKEHKISPEKRLVRKFEKLNGLTGKFNSVKDVVDALKSGKTMGSEVSEIMKDIGKDVRHSMKMARASAASAVKAPVR